MGDGRNLTADFENLALVRDWHELALLGVEGLEVERGPKRLQDAAPDRVFAGLAVVQEVRRREEAGHGRDAAGFTIDGILGIGVRPSSSARPCIRERWPPADAP